MILPRTLLVLALSASGLAWGAPTDAPARIARLSYVEGQVAFRAAEEVASYALPDRPLVPGDRVSSEAGGRAELALGTATVRLDEQSAFSITTLDDKAVRIALDNGSMSVHLRELYGEETFAVATPNTTITFLEPGEYRISVPTEGTTDLTVRGGSADGVTAGGPVRVAAGQRVRFEGRQALANLVPSRSNDAFDNWVLEREVQLGQQQPSTDALASGDEYRELDSYGEWHEDSRYGRVWMPGYAYGGYDPFRYGYWDNYGGGRAWVSPMPWYYYTYYSGRWTYLDQLDRWGWVPARRRHGEPVAGRPPIGIPLGNGRPREGGKDRPDRPATLAPRRIDTDLTPVRRDAGSMKPSQRETSAPRTDRAQPAPERSASQPRSGSTPTMRPSQPSRPRTEPTSSPPATFKREDGKVRTD